MNLPWSSLIGHLATQCLAGDCNYKSEARAGIMRSDTRPRDTRPGPPEICSALAQNMWDRSTQTEAVHSGVRTVPSLTLAMLCSLPSQGSVQSVSRMWSSSTSCQPSLYHLRYQRISQSHTRGLPGPGMWVVCHVMCPLTVYVQVLESVQYWLHQTVGESLQLIIPQFQPLQRMEIFESLIWNSVYAETCSDIK